MIFARGLILEITSKLNFEVKKALIRAFYYLLLLIQQ
jgi:hypothetical protein